MFHIGINLSRRHAFSHHDFFHHGRPTLNHHMRVHREWCYAPFYMAANTFLFQYWSNLSRIVRRITGMHLSGWELQLTTDRIGSDRLLD